MYSPSISKSNINRINDSNINGISIIIPCFNSTKTIKCVLESVLQNVITLPFEILVIDDGSTDTVAQICQNLSIKVQYYWKENGGVASARNFGVAKAKYKYIAFLDSDDIWLPSKVSEQIKYIRDLNLRFIGCGWSNRFYPFNQTICKISPGMLPFKWWPHISTVIIERELFMEVGGFNENMRHAEDGDFLMKIAKAGQLYCIKENLVMTAIQKKTNYESGLSSNLRLMYLGELSIINTHIDGLLIKILYKAVISIKFIMRVINRILSQ